MKVDIDEYVKLIIRKTIYDLMLHADSDQCDIVCEYAKDYAAAILYDNIEMNNLTLDEKVHIILGNDLKDIFKAPKDMLTKKYLHNQFNEFIFSICEGKLIKLGFMKEFEENFF